jgi:hypothetical protein
VAARAGWYEMGTSVPPLTKAPIAPHLLEAAHATASSSLSVTPVRFGERPSGLVALADDGELRFARLARDDLPHVRLESSETRSAP